MLLRNICFNITCRDQNVGTLQNVNVKTYIKSINKTAVLRGADANSNT